MNPLRSELRRVIAAAGVIALAAVSSPILTLGREKEHSIYVDLNLLVSLKGISADGLADTIDALERKDQKVLGFFTEDKDVHPPAGSI